MIQPLTLPSADATLADLATAHAGASRVFHRHRLDFCCRGRARLADACVERGLDLGSVLAELHTELARDGAPSAWSAAPLGALADHIVEHYHESHRAELPRLVALAEKVESVHRDVAACPRGLAAHLRRMEEELVDHMGKEELVLFPLVRAGRGHLAVTPIQVLEHEHRDHGARLERMRELAHGYAPPADACGSWRALYLGLDALERELMEHIHLENHVLFPRALRGQES